MKKSNSLPFILSLSLGLITQILLGLWVVEELVFMDSTSTMFESIMYLLAVIPPFLIALLFYKETQRISKSLGYSGIFYVISAILINFYHKISGKIHDNYLSIETPFRSRSGTDFYVTGAGIEASSVIPHILLTIIIVLILNKFKK